MKPNRTLRTWIALCAAVALAGAALVAGASGDGHEHEHGPPEAPYYQVEVQKGYIECAVGSSAAATDDVCGELAGADLATLKFRIPQGTNVALAEMAWSVNGALGGKQLSLTAPATLDSDATKRYEGKSPLRAEIRSDRPDGLAQEIGIGLEAGAAHDLSLVVDQAFSLAVTSFVGQEIPDGYSAWNPETPPEEDPGHGGGHHDHGGDLGHEPPGPGDPYFVAYYSTGLIKCAAGALVAATDNVCPQFLVPGDHSVQKFLVPAGADVAIVEMRWISTNAFGSGSLALTAPKSLEGEGEQRVEGKSILRLTVPASHAHCDAAEGALFVTAGAAHDSGIVLDQKFEMVVTVFVDMPVPEGYTGFP